MNGVVVRVAQRLPSWVTFAVIRLTTSGSRHQQFL